MKHFTSKTQKTGELGEKICLQYLKNSSFTIIEVNYTKSVGEIDIIAMKDRTLHFIEVKSSKISKKVSYETYNPAQNLTRQKFHKIQQTIQIYCLEKRVSHETDWQIDLYCVYIDQIHEKHKIQVFENITFS